jgi:hypothetical protein
MINRNAPGADEGALPPGPIPGASMPWSVEDEKPSPRSGDREPAARLTSLILLGLVCLLPRLAFMSRDSFGSDSDGWRMVHTGIRLHEMHTYTASRYPGFPLVELTFGILGSDEPAVLNGLVVLLSEAAVILFALILIELHVRRWLWLAISFSLTPLVFGASIVAMDYMWSLTAILGCMLALLKRNIPLAGILLGLAIASRITAVLMWLPFALLLGSLVPPTRSRYWWLLAKFSGVAAAVACILFLPAFWDQGLTHFRRLSVMASQPSVLIILYRATEKVWGLAGLVGVAVGCGAVVAAMVSRRMSCRAGEVRGVLLCSTLGIILFMLAFVRMPETPGYLVPMVPLVLLVFALMVQRNIIYVVCACLSISGFIMGFADAQTAHRLNASAQIEVSVPGREWAICPLTGDVPLEKEKVRLGAEGLENLVRIANGLPRGSRVISGTLSPMLELSMRRAGSEVVVTELISEEEMDRLLSQHVRIFCFEGFEPRGMRGYQKWSSVSVVDAGDMLNQKLRTFD